MINKLKLSEARLAFLQSTNLIACLVHVKNWLMLSVSLCHVPKWSHLAASTVHQWYLQMWHLVNLGSFDHLNQMRKHSVKTLSSFCNTIIKVSLLKIHSKQSFQTTQTQDASIFISGYVLLFFVSSSGLELQLFQEIWNLNSYTHKNLVYLKNDYSASNIFNFHLTKPFRLFVNSIYSNLNYF